MLRSSEGELGDWIPARIALALIALKNFEAIPWVHEAAHSSAHRVGCGWKSRSGRGYFLESRTGTVRKVDPGYLAGGDLLPYLGGWVFRWIDDEPELAEDPEFDTHDEFRHEMAIAEKLLAVWVKHGYVDACVAPSAWTVEGIRPLRPLEIMTMRGDWLASGVLAPGRVERTAYSVWHDRERLEMRLCLTHAEWAARAVLRPSALPRGALTKDLVTRVPYVILIGRDSFTRFMASWWVPPEKRDAFDAACKKLIESQPGESLPGRQGGPSIQAWKTVLAAWLRGDDKTHSDSARRLLDFLPDGHYKGEKPLNQARGALKKRMGLDKYSTPGEVPSGLQP